MLKHYILGGGTPSIINQNFIEQIINTLKSKFNFDKNIEITIEINPGTIDYNKLNLYKKIGINRLSIGLQSTNDRLLNLIGRIHNYRDFKEAYNIARAVGFNNINVDLMIGLPTQTLEDVNNSLIEIISKKPEHISVYSLIVEDGTKIKTLIDGNKLNLPNEDTERRMYWLVKNMLENSGYKHYEISNFSKLGYQSKHNMDCWKQKEYLGFGLAAHSYYNNVRYSNCCDLKKYILNINNDEFENNIIIEEIQSQKSKMDEYVILALRTIDGLSKEEFYKKFNKNFEEVYNLELLKLVKEGYIKNNKKYVALTNRGLDFANIVWSEFI